VGALRGKRHWQRVDASVRAAAREVAQHEQAERDVAATPRPVEAPVAEVPKSTRAIRTRHGWHEVVRVNAKSVTVRTAYSWDECVPLDRILEVVPRVDHQDTDEPTVPSTRGAPMSSTPTVDSTGEAVNIAAARAALDAIVAAANQAVGAIDNLSASMHSADLDTDTLSEVATVLEAASAMQAAAAKARSGLDDRHAVMEEAVNTTPHAAKTDFYRH